MISRNADSSQGEGCGTSSPIVPDDRGRAADTANAVFKSGPLFISSKGIGWTSWKKRWFILTRTSLVFFRSEPSALPSKGGDVNLTLGGIDLNNSGSVVVRADKKLLTVLFPDGREGRAFTLKAETSEDMYEWKAALENALAQAPNAALVVGQNGIFRNDTADTVEGSVEQCKDRPVKSMVVGRPILLALEDIDGSPSFLEKALRFIEEYGIKVEGILRQSADVEEVERRVREYEEGKNAFSPDEDAHVVGDCVKHILRESPSSPVPASCCTALLEAYRNGHGDRVDSLRGAISEAFPEPNRRLLERILRMMQTVSFHTSVNRMSSSAVAACMAPLLLRPLMAGDCELKDDFGMNGDGCSAQLLAAAAAANHAHAIVSILLEEYDYIFADDHSQRGPVSSEMYSGSEEESGSERSTDDAIMDIEEDGYHDADHDHDVDSEEDSERLLSETLSESSGIAGSDLSDNKVQFSEGLDSDADSSKDQSCSEGDRRPLRARSLSHVHDSLQIRSGNLQTEEDNSLGLNDSESRDSLGDFFTSTSLKLDSSGFSISSCSAQSKSKVNGSVSNTKRPTVWGRTGARKNLPMDSIDSSVEDEIAIQRLEATKNDLQNKIAKEAKGNAILQASLERRKQALHERRLALEQDVARLQEQLQRERDLRATLEAGLNMALGNFISSKMDSKVRVELEETAIAEADVINLKQKVADLHLQLNQQRHHNCSSLCESCSQHQCAQNHEVAQKKTQAQDFESKVVVSPLERSQICEDFSSGIDTERVRTQDETSLQNKEPPQRQQTNSPIPAGSTSNGISASPSIEPLTVATSTSKKLSAKKKLDLPSGVDSEKVTTPDKPSLQNVEPDQRQHMDSPIPSGSRSTVPSTITSTEPLTVASSNSFKKPSATKNESPLPNNAADERSGVTRPKQSNAPLEVVDLEIADIIELEKVRQWKDLMSRADAEKGTSKDQPSLQSKELPHGQSPDLPIRPGSRSSMASANPSTEPLSTSAKKHSWKKSWDFSSGLDLEKVRSQDKPSLQNKETHNRQRPDSPIPTGARSAVASAIPSIEPTVAPGTSAKKNSLKKSWDFSFGLDWEKVKTHDKPSSQNKEPLHKQLPESSSPAGSKSTIAFPNPSNEERSTAAPSMSKKHNAKSELHQGRSSAFSKLSVRLNFMKEKRSQIIAELQNFRVNSSPDSQALTKTELS